MTKTGIWNPSPGTISNTGFGFSPKTLAVFGGKSLVSTLSGEFPEILRRLENREGDSMHTTIIAQTTPAPTCQAAWSAFIAAATCLAPQSGAIHPRAIPRECPKSWGEIEAAVEAAKNSGLDQSQTILVTIGYLPFGWQGSDVEVLVLQYGAGRSYVQVEFMDNDQGAWLTTGIRSNEPLDIQETDRAVLSWKRRQRAVSKFCGKNEPAWLSALHSKARQCFEEETRIEIVRRKNRTDTD